jgi:S-DNA-T family DNA segregation ATPase FtsK/SpoIIIE
MEDTGAYQLPDADELLTDPSGVLARITDDELKTQSEILSKALLSFGIEGRVTEVRPGPVVTMYEFEPAPGTKVVRIVNLADDLALAMKAISLRIVAPIPGKSVVGIEVPNTQRETVSMKEVATSDAFSRARSKLTLALGKDIFGAPVTADLKTMPHLLVAGATGAGKSVSLNTMLISILLSAKPHEVKLLLIDPKMLEFQTYDGIPHLLRPVITDPKSAARGLSWVVQEMERRYKLPVPRACFQTPAAKGSPVNRNCLCVFSRRRTVYPRGKRPLLMGSPDHSCRRPLRRNLCRSSSS